MTTTRLSAFVTALLMFGTFTCMQAQQTYAYVERDSTLYLDVYAPAGEPNGYTVLHIFGGGFAIGKRNSEWNAMYCRQLQQSGYCVVAIDYRLGLKGATKVGVLHREPLENAIWMAAEDCSAAVAYIVKHAAELNIDPGKIILEGSSAGAITVLMTEYGRCNRMPFVKELPEGWKPAGIVSYSGAIYSKDGKAQWPDTNVAPMLLYHGTADRLVPYKQISFGKIGFFGTDALVKQLEKYDLRYAAYRYSGLGHEVSTAGRRAIDELNLFVKQFITEQRKLQTDITISDGEFPPAFYSKWTTKDLYKNRSSAEVSALSQ